MLFYSEFCNGFSLPNIQPHNVNPTLMEQPHNVILLPNIQPYNVNPTIMEQHHNVILYQTFNPTMLKLPSLFAAWLFWTFPTKSHNMKALVILSHSWLTFLLLTCLYGNKLTFVGVCGVFWSIFLRKNFPQIIHENHMTMTTSGQF